MSVRVLIVDDQESFRAAAREVIRATDGFELAGEAITGEESVEAARRLRPDLVLMDVNLPGMNGMEASQKIRSEDGKVVVFLLSTYDQSEFAAGVVSSGASTFIPKAVFSPARLTAAWKEIV